MTTIGFIGLGHMGQPMVNNLIKNNWLVKVYDVIDEAVEKAVKTGATAAASPAEVAEEADVVLYDVTNERPSTKLLPERKGNICHYQSSSHLYRQLIH